MEPTPASIEGRVSALEREMFGLKSTLRAAIAVVLFMGGGYWWYANKSVDKLEFMASSMSTIQTDVLLIKQDNLRKDWERRLINAMVKKGATDVSKSITEE